MKELSTLLAAVAVAAAADTASAEVWAIPGTYQDWHPEEVECTPGENGTYVLEIADFYGDFKVVRYDNPGEANWNNEYGTNGSTIEVGTAYSAVKGGGNIVLAGDNVHLVNAKFTLTPGVDNALTILVEAERVVTGDETWQLMGDDPLTWNFQTAPKFVQGDNGVWTLAYTGAITDTFKVVKNAAWVNSYSTKGEIALNETYTLEGPADPLDTMKPAAGPWENPVFTLTVGDTVTLKVTAEGAGVEAVEADAANGEAVYHNLQGQRVANPENGLYIRLQGGKAAKVAL